MDSVESKRNNDTLQPREYIVGVFDVLGQTDELRKIKKLPSSENPDERAEMGENLRRTFGVIDDFKKSFKAVFDGFKTSPIRDNPSKYGIRADVMDALYSNDIEFRRFSDTFLVYMSLDKSTGKIFPLRGILGITAAAGLMLLNGFDIGHPIRGGIELGVGWEHEGEFYGPALVMAHDLESKKAQYPRVVIGSNLVDYLKGLARDSVSAVSSLNLQHAPKCINAFCEDVDGQTIIDYLGDDFKRDFAQNRLGADYLDKCYQFVMDESAKYQNIHDVKLAFRYTVLRDYFEKRLGKVRFEA